jgi:hypothetical protein
MVKTTSDKRGKNPRSVTTQFKKGAPSPNPDGRPSGSPNRNKVIREVLSKFVTGDMDGRKKKIAITEASLLRLSQKALAGELKAIQMVLALWKETEDAIAEQRGAQYPFNESDRSVIEEIYARMKVSEG